MLGNLKAQMQLLLSRGLQSEQATQQKTGGVVQQADVVMIFGSRQIPTKVVRGALSDDSSPAQKKLDFTKSSCWMIQA